MRILCGILLFFSVLGFSQKYSKAEKDVLIQAKKLDSLMKNNDPKIVNLFAEDVSFGHSNGWIQNLDDFKKRFRLEESDLQTNCSV